MSVDITYKKFLILFMLLALFKISWNIEFFYHPQGMELKKQIGALAYVECSSKTQQVCSVSWFFSINTELVALL